MTRTRPNPALTKEPAPTLTVNGAALTPDPSGALIWPARRLLVVADLHLEKGSSFAASGRLLPPYDSRATLAALDRVIETHRPDHVVCLGDSFHDTEAAARLSDAEVATIHRLTAAHRWTWIAGNHDPDPPSMLGGETADTLTLGPLTFRHQAVPDRPAPGELSGHFHPKATVATRGRRITARCFVTDGRRAILPSFGAYTGGLDVLDPAIAGLFRRAFTVHMLGRERIHAVERRKLLPWGRG
jgi:DNA ligase-associated metallophosphoesterase